MPLIGSKYGEFVPAKIWTMDQDEAARRAYARQRHVIIERVVAYYREYIEAMGVHWPSWRATHEQWLVSNFGDETAHEIMERVRGWKDGRDNSFP